MSNGQISSYDVTRIVQQQLESVIREIRSMDGRLTGLEGEMANVEGAIGRMHEALASELGRIREGNAQLVRIQETTKQITHDQLTAANSKLGVANASLGALNVVSKEGFSALDAGIDRMAQALVQTEVVRLLHEATEPLERVNNFNAEIEQRFSRAVENVYAIRTQYDQLQQAVMSEYDSKLRLVGEHIFKIKDEEVAPAEANLCEPPERSVALPLAMDEERRRKRGEALEGRFDEMGDELIEPLLSAHRELERLLVSRFAAPAGLPRGQEIAQPVAVRLREGAVEVLGTVRPVSVRAHEQGDERVVLALEPADDPALNERLSAQLTPLQTSIRTVALDPEQRAAVLEAIRRLAAAGRLDADLVPGFEDYMNRFGINVVAEQEVSAP